MDADFVLFRLSLDVYEISKAAVGGHCKAAYFHKFIPGLLYLPPTSVTTKGL